jgi:antitoxin HicB
MRIDDSVLNAYPFAIRRMSADEGEGFLIEFPDVPGCISDGSTPEEAVSNGHDALKSVLLTKQEFKDPIPRPGAFAAASGQFRQRIPKSLHARLVARASQEGVSLNTLVTAFIAEGLGRTPGTDTQRKRSRICTTPPGRASRAPRKAAS